MQVLEAIKLKVSIPAVMITAYPDDEFIEKAKELGAYGYLIKTVIENQLKSAIEMAMGRYKDLQKQKTLVNKAEKALADRKKIERAKGILMDSFGLKEADAQKALQKKSRDQNKKLVEVAEDILKNAQILL